MVQMGGRVRVGLPDEIRLAVTALLQRDPGLKLHELIKRVQAEFGSGGNGTVNAPTNAETGVGEFSQAA
jgi:hypothetical protein